MSDRKISRTSLRRLLAASAAGALLVTGCASNGAGGGSGGGGGDGGSSESIAIMRIQADPTSLNPAMTTGYPDQSVGSIIYEGLTVAGDDGLAAPGLAETWEVSDDGLEYTFHLRDALWHDGEPLTSADVKFTYENISIQYGPVWGRVQDIFVGVDTPDDKTAVVKLESPYAPMLLLTRTSHNGAILPKHIFEDVDLLDASPLDVNPVGTGAYAFDEYVPGQHVTLKRFDDYWQGTPTLDSVVAQIIPNVRSAISSFQAGELDFLPQLAGSEVAEIEDMDFATVDTTIGANPSADYMFFNVERPIVDDPAVRRALVKALDREYIIEHVYFGLGEPGAAAMLDSWARSGDVNYNVDLAFNLEEAAAELDAAGYPVNPSTGSRFSLKFVTISDPPELEQLAVTVQAMWDQVDVDVEVVRMERATFLDATSTGTDYDVTSQQLTSFGDPAAGTARVYVCGSIGVVFANSSRYCNPELDEVWNAAAAAVELEERQRLYREIDLALLEEMPAIPIREYQGKYAVRSDLNLVVRQGAIEWHSATFN